MSASLLTRPKVGGEGCRFNAQRTWSLRGTPLSDFVEPIGWGRAWPGPWLPRPWSRRPPRRRGWVRPGETDFSRRGARGFRAQARAADRNWQLQPTLTACTNSSICALCGPPPKPYTRHRRWLENADAMLKQATNKMRAALVQMCTGRDLDRNLRDARELIREAAGRGAEYVQTPEVTSLMEMERARLFAVLEVEEGNRAVGFFAELALELKVWL